MIPIRPMPWDHAPVRRQRGLDFRLLRGGAVTTAIVDPAMLALRRASPTAVVLGERLIGPRGEPAGAPSSSQATYPQGSDTRHTAFDLPPYRTSKTMEIIMAVVRCDDYSPYGMTCPQCNDLMIAPSRSAYVSSNSALHCWSCDTCGHDAEIFDRFVRLSGVETAFWRFQT